MALDFDGVDQWVTIADSPLWDFGGGDFTLYAHIWPHVLDAGSGGILDRWKHDTDQRRWQLAAGLNWIGFLASTDGTDPGSTVLLYTDASLVDAPRTVFGVRDGNTMRLIIDNVERDSGAFVGAIPNDNLGIRIGSDLTDRATDCVIYECRIYNRCLSAAERAIIHYAKGADNIVDGLVARWPINERPDGAAAAGANTVIDISGHGHHGTPQNAPVYRAAPVKLVKPDLSMTRRIYGFTFEESISLLESLPTIERQLTLEEAVALKESLSVINRKAPPFEEALALKNVSDVPACPDIILGEALALKEFLTEISRALLLTEAIALKESLPLIRRQLLPLEEAIAFIESLPVISRQLPPLEEAIALKPEIHAEALLFKIDKSGNITYMGTLDEGAF